MVHRITNISQNNFKKYYKELEGTYQPMGIPNTNKGHVHNHIMIQRDAYTVIWFNGGKRFSPQLVEISQSLHVHYIERIIVILV